MNLDRLLVYWVKVVKNDIKPDPLGGEIETSDEIRAIFEKLFLGNEKGGPKIQPFHFNLGGQIRNNVARDRILNLLKDSRTDLNLLGLEMATELQKLVDDRIGDLLLAIGLGWTTDKKRCALWVFPSDSPIQLGSEHGKPTLTEIKNAFTRKSRYRKAIFFEGPIDVTRSDFLWGDLIDSTRQGKSRSVAQYWVERFLYGRIALSSARGIQYLVRGIKQAQQAAKTPEERTSVIAAYSRLLSGGLDKTTLNQFSGMLVGESRKAYIRVMPSTIEKDAVFVIEMPEVRRKIKRIVYVLQNGVTVIFPSDQSVDPVDYITDSPDGRQLAVEGTIESEGIE